VSTAAYKFKVYLMTEKGSSTLKEKHLEKSPTGINGLDDITSGDCQKVGLPSYAEVRADLEEKERTGEQAPISEAQITILNSDLREGTDKKRSKDGIQLSIDSDFKQWYKT
jgi:hypothetical protein